MRLSDAMVLGDSLRARNSTTYGRKTGNQWEGCALTGALLAVGAVPDLCPRWDGSTSIGYLPSHIRQQWPWMTAQQQSTISHMFHGVCGQFGYQRFSFEAVVEYVKTIEPAEPAPAVIKEEEAVCV